MSSDALLPVSAVVANLNDLANLKECVSSLEACNLAEVIVVDGMSRDGSTEFIKSNYSQVKVLQEKSHLIRQRIRGIQEATSGLILLCDSDDLFDPFHVRIAFEELMSSELSGVQFRAKGVDVSFWSTAWSQLNQTMYSEKNLRVLGRPCLFRKDSFSAVYQLPIDFPHSKGEDQFFSAHATPGSRWQFSKAESLRVFPGSLRESITKCMQYGRGDWLMANKDKNSGRQIRDRIFHISIRIGVLRFIRALYSSRYPGAVLCLVMSFFRAVGLLSEAFRQVSIRIGRERTG